MVLSAGFSRIVSNRRFEDYRSMKQHFQHRFTKEYIISGSGTTAGAEFEFATEAMDYIGTEAQATIRTELDDATQHSKYVYMTYTNDDGVILGPVTADLDGANSTTEVNIGAADFWRIRELYTEVASLATKAIVITDADMDAAARWGMVEDNETQWHAQRYFVPSATQVEHSYLGRVIATGPQIAAAAAAVDSIILTITLTPKVITGAEDQLAADKDIILTWNKNLDWQPCIELEPATDVIFSWNHTTTGQVIWFEADFLEVYVKV